jgi:hypothetical protein
MGIWLELGIFVLFLLWCLWQLHDVKQARAKTLADKARAQQEAGRDSGPP